MPVSSVRRSTAKVPSSAGEPPAPAATDPLSAFVFASKLPPIVIGQTTRTSLWPARHVLAAAIVAEVTNSMRSADFIYVLNPSLGNAPFRSADDSASIRRAVVCRLG